MLITNTGQSVPQIMNPFIWVFVTLLSIGAVQDMGGLAALFG
ncbi:KPN_01571 family protein [Scandinavium sp. NPDC088450]